MKFGYFDDINKEYVITTPKTPTPWINYLGNSEFFSLISNTCGGYSFYKDAKLMRLTRYRYNNVPNDQNGKYYYIKDGDTVWNVAWQPTKTDLDFYECRHGLGYSKFKSSKNEIMAELTAFVPLGDNCEINHLTITNNSQDVKEITLTSYVEFCFWNAVDDMTNFQRNYSIGEVEVCNSEIYHKTEYRERRNHYAVYSVNTDIDGFDTSRNDFLGEYRGVENPQVVFDGKAKNSVASGWAVIGSHSINIKLQPNESKRLIFVLAYCENSEDYKWESLNVINKKNAKALLKKYSTDEQVENAFNKLREYWNNLLNKYTIDCDDDKLCRMVNIWNQYQCMVTFNMSRSASYYESGTGRGMGFRDSCQDLLGFVHLIPDRARQRILDIASTQFEDGSAYHQYQPLTKKGNMDIGSGFNDDPLWLIACVSAYIKETGDFDILNEMVDFDNDSSKAKPLMEHLKRSFDFTVNNLGPHGLPLIGRADWNDCLNLNCFSKEPSEPFQITGSSEGSVAESVFIAVMFVTYGKEYSQICKLTGNDEEAKRAEKLVNDVYNAVIEHGWDGEWFLRAYDAFGNKVGSKDCMEGKIFIEPQGFCVLANIGVKEGLAKKALDSVDKYLDTKYGIILQTPAYSKYYLNLGEISSYPPGYKENAGIFCHNNPWISIAQTVVKNGNRAFEIYKKICPAYIEDISDIHKTEPYVYSQMIAGRDAKNFGEAKNSWLTGTSAWTFVNVSQYILGVKPDYMGLRIDPCISSDFDKINIKRFYRNAWYNIEINNVNKSSDCVIELDGERLNDNIIPYNIDKKVYNVKVFM